MTLTISIDAAEAICIRCGARAPMRPQTLRFNPSSSTSPFPGPPHPTEFGTATDDAGGSWQVVGVERPFGWSAIDHTPNKGFCEPCGVAWAQVTAEFLAPPQDENSTVEAPAKPKVVLAPAPLAIPNMRMVSSPAPLAMESTRPIGRNHK